MTIEQTLGLTHELLDTLGLCGALKHADLQETLAAEQKDYEAEAIWCHVGMIIRGDVMLPSELPMVHEVAA